MKKLNIASFDFENMKDVSLCEELQAYVEPFPQLGGEMLRHPLVYAVPYAPQLNELYNKQLEIKQQSVDVALSKKKWGQVIWLHERPYRLHAFLMCTKYGVAPDEHWRLLGEVWVDAEAPGFNLGTWLALFTADLPARAALMQADERHELANMPDILTAYRGVNSRYEFGISWTLDYARAEFFAHRYGGADKTPRVYRGSVKKKDVLAYFSRRGESEIVVTPNDVYHIQEMKS